MSGIFGEDSRSLNTSSSSVVPYVRLSTVARLGTAGSIRRIPRRSYDNRLEYGPVVSRAVEMGAHARKTSKEAPPNHPHVTLLLNNATTDPSVKYGHGSGVGPVTPSKLSGQICKRRGTRPGLRGSDQIVLFFATPTRPLALVKCYILLPAVFR